MSYLTEKSIGELIELNFFIPSYQRGYRWTDMQVLDLLNDVWDFINKPIKKENEWYCLQPIVVKKTNNQYEVLDGQQRLTTIFLILKHLEKFVEGNRISFEIEYETRNTIDSNSKDFLQNISSKKEEHAYDNIDYLHIYNAFKVIREWFNDKAKKGEKTISSKFITPFLERTKVIWYEVDPDKDSIEIFTRINMGKIQLTNAELIKALFLNSSNFDHLESEYLRLRQLEIASEWDRIEYALQSKDLWYFINNSNNEMPTRIEYIFKVMKELDGVEIGSDPFSTFRFFSNKFKNATARVVEENWKEIKSIFQIISEWFEDRELYHKIGFLIASGADIKELLRESKLKKKSDFRVHINLLIAKKVECDSFEEIVYGKNQLIRNILLLHNINTMLKSENDSSRFPFYRFKNDTWDIEHIHAVATEMPQNPQHRVDWLNNAKEFIDDRVLVAKISDFVKNYDSEIIKNPDSFNGLAEIILKYYSEKGNMDLEVNDLSNLVLLDSGTNRSYKNAVFPSKRKTIIEKDKNGSFIPICTKNVFQKYYTKDVNQLTFWSNKDRIAYIEDIKKIVKMN